MFRKVLGGIALFFVVVFLAVGALATVGVAVAGSAVSAVVEDIDSNPVIVTGVNGENEIYTVRELLDEAGRVEIIGDGGDHITVDFDSPQLSIEQSGQIVPGETGLVINGQNETVRLNGRNVERIDRFPGHFPGLFFGRILGGAANALFSLAFWGLVIFGVVMVLRKRQTVVVDKPA